MFRILSVLLKQWPVACDLCFVPALDGRSEQANKAYVKNAKQLEHVQSACVRSLSLVLRGRESQQFYINDRWIRFNRKIIKEEDYMTLQKTTKWIEITSLPKDRANTLGSILHQQCCRSSVRKESWDVIAYLPTLYPRKK